MSTFSAWRLRTAVLACATVGALLTGTTAVATGPTAPSYRDFESQVHLLAPPHVLPAAGTTTPRPLAASQLSYGGGPTGVEINPKVYLIFWGSQWSGDSHGVVDYVTRFFQGLGTASDGWSRVTSQYCDGVPRGTVTCGSAGQHPTFTGAVLAGTWMDNSRPAPAQASSAAIAAEATAGAAHFGNTTSGSNRDAQYVVLSPSGTHPDGFPNAGWCAWHNGTSSPYGSLAFTNDPYFGDTSNCGKNWINSYLDGWGIVAGHEYSETVSDARPNSGWTDSGGQENADKCIWIRTGPGAIADYPLPTGQFAVQSTWSNKDAGCLLAVPVQPGPNPPTGLTVTGTTANSASLAWTASTSTGIAHYTVRQNGTAVATPTATSYTAGGLANGVYRFSVTATDGQGRESASSNEVTVTIGTGGCTPQQLLTNPGFESGASAWASTANVIVKPGDLGGSAHAGLYAAWLNGVGATHTDTLSQQVAVPAGCAAQLSFYLRLTTAETTTTAAYDTVKVQVLNPSGTVLATLATYSNLDANADYVLRSFSLSGYAGQTVTLAFTGVEDTSLQTSFLIDDTAVTVS